MSSWTGKGVPPFLNSMQHTNMAAYTQQSSSGVTGGQGKIYLSP